MSDRDALVRDILEDLQRERDAHPDVIYELRGDSERRDVPRLLRSDEGGDRWEYATRLADTLSGQLCTHLDVYQVRIFADLSGRETRREESYVLTSCGGGPYWQDGTTLHQIGSAGFCWTCLSPDPDLGQAQRGLVRHPVTPGEIGQPAYRCHVCGEDMTGGRDEHRDVEHLVIWGEEHHPRCGSCGLGYQTATPEGIGYEDHADGCPEILVVTAGEGD